MCNLYKVTKTASEIARLFSAHDSTRGANLAEEVYPGYPGLVIAEGQLRRMSWGFPLALKSKKTGQPLKPKPVNNARTDKLAGGFWRNSFEHRRCLIPVAAFAEAEGEAGRMTRTWISLPDQPVFACAGIWRWCEEWGEVFSMVMTEPCDATACVHDRMPVILPPDTYGTWVEGASAEAFALCQPYEGAVTIEQTGEPWAKR
jgi:putative SOS response-associated peptidase YedK